MNCPKCGKQLNEGDLFCEYCSAEIKMVPEFDAQVEQSINETMSGIKDDVGKAAALEQQLLMKKERRRRKQRQAILVMCGVCVGVVSVGLWVIVSHVITLKSESHYVGLAYEQAEAGEYLEAAASIDNAISLQKEEEEGYTLIFLKSEYLSKAGKNREAITALNDVTKEPNISIPDLVKAYGQLISIYQDENDYETIADILSSCNVEEVKTAYREYMSYPPIFDCVSGEYEDTLKLSLSTDGIGTIFYTTDGTKPSIHSTLYQKPIEMANGEYTISAIMVNHFGVYSNVVKHTYDVSPAQPDPPVVDTPSGSYNKPTLISVEHPNSGTVYYTTDGSEPTKESREYSKAISMPIGNSQYRFAIIDENGTSSEIVDCNYSLHISGSFSIEDGPNYILVALINAGEVIDVNGTIRDGSARYSYTYQGLKQIAGYGNFYVYSETLTDLAGNAVATGRRFAVNISNATVNLYSDAGGGKVTLF